jgi:uncharacterized protein with HEPN domain
MPAPLPDADLARLSDMLTFARLAVEASATIRAETLSRLSGDAAKLERWLEIIGEAANGVSEAYKSLHPEIPWRKIIATRHIIAHEYGKVNYDTIWRIVTEYLPELIQQLTPLVPPELPDPEPEDDA